MRFRFSSAAGGVAVKYGAMGGGLGLGHFTRGRNKALRKIWLCVVIVLKRKSFVRSFLGKQSTQRNGVTFQNLRDERREREREPQESHRG